MHVHVRPLIAAFALAAAAGCATEVVPATAHAPSNPATVQVYQNAPNAKYENLGVVSVPVAGEVRWDNKGDANAGFAELRKAAAARGANGILLDSDTFKDNTTVLAGDHGTYYTVPVRFSPNRAALAEAIYVHKED